MSVSTLIPSDVSFNLKENTTFSQYAYDISGAESGGLAGQSISKNLAGDIIAVGAPLNSGGGTARGEVRVYQKNNDSWLQLGNDLNGTKDNEEFGHSVDLNGDGTILAVGTKDISHNTLVYKYDSGSWGLYGNSIYLNNNLNPKYETSVVATSDAAGFVVNYEFRGTDYSAGTVPNPYSDNTGNSESYDVGNDRYIDSDDGITGGGNFTCTADNIDFKYLEVYYNIDSNHRRRFIQGENDDKSDMFEFWGQNDGFYFYNKKGGANKMKWYGVYPSSVTLFNTWNHLIVDPTNRRYWINGSQQNYSTSQFHTTSWTGMSITKIFGFTGGYCRYFRLHGNTMNRNTLYNNRDVVNFGYDTVLTEIKRENGSTKPKLNKTGNKLTILNELQYADLVSNGFVQSYQYSESDASWNYLGNKIESVSVNDISGGDIAINDEGNMIAIGYPQINSATGSAKVFKYDTSWNQIGSNIDGSATGDHAGTSVVIDGSGDFVAIGSPFAGDASAGEVNVYQNVSDTWTLYGNKIQGQSDNDQFGTSIDMTPAGNILAVGAPNANAGKGNVNIYQYNETDSSWNQLGGDLSGAEVGHLTGTSVKLNQLGTEVSVGEPGSNPSPPYENSNGAHVNAALYWNFAQDITTTTIGGDIGPAAIFRGDDGVGDDEVITATLTESDGLTTGYDHPDKLRAVTKSFVFPSDTFTIELYLKLWQPRTEDTFLEYCQNGINSDPEGNYGRFWFYRNSSTTVTIKLWDDWGSSSTKNYDNGTFQEDTWHHMVFVCDFTTASQAHITMYQNGIYTDENTHTRRSNREPGFDRELGVTTAMNYGSTSANYNHKQLQVIDGLLDATEVAALYTKTVGGIGVAKGGARTFELSHTLNYEANIFQSSYLDGFLDISGGELRTRNADDHLLIGGDASMSGNVFVKGNETIENKNIILSSTLIDISFSQLENTNFTQYAYDISGAEFGGLAGQSISTSASGDIIAVGAPLNSGGGTARGEVRVYKKDNNSWLQLGNELNGAADNDEFGHSVDLNGDGTILGVGSKDTSNNLIIYQYDGSVWNQYGNNIHVVNNNISYNSHSLTPAIKVKLNKEGNKLVTTNKYNVTDRQVSITTVTHTSPYVTAGCTNNWDFRTVSSVGVTDDINSINVTYETGYSTSDAGSSTVENGFLSDFYGTNGQFGSVGQAMKIQNGFTYGGSNWSVECYVNIIEWNEWSRLFCFLWNPFSNYIEVARGNNDQYSVRLNGDSGGSMITASIGYGAKSSTTNKWVYHTNGQFLHMVFTISGGNVVIYHDGVSVGSGSLTNPQNAYTSSDPKYHAIGARYDNGSSWAVAINAYWRYFRYYHGKTLSASEVTDLYNDRDDTSTANARDGTTQEGQSSVTTISTTDYENEVVQAYEYSSSTWNQVGNSIESSSLNDLSGGDIAINDEGNMITVGYPQTNSATGTTKVFKYDASWNQVGSNIDGSATGDHAGTAVVMDGSGDFVAIGSPFANITLNNTVTNTTVNGVQIGTQIDDADLRINYTEGTLTGRSSAAISGNGNRIITAGKHAMGQNFHGDLKIADWDGSQWNITLDISHLGISFDYWLHYNTTGYDRTKYYYVNFGYGVSLSYDGNTVAIGAPNTGSTTNYQGGDLGSVFIFKWDGSEWTLSADIGPGTQEFGHTVNLNKSIDPSIDGTVVLIGEEYNNNGCGAVSVYEYDGATWNQKGQTIVGGSEDYMETSACINSDGTMFACGSWKRNRVLVYEWNDGSSTWTQKSNIGRPSGASGTHFGSTTQMTGDGLTIVIGAIDSRYETYTGEVYVYEWNGSGWQQKGQTITNTGMGHKVAVNNDGTVLAVSGLKIASDNYSEAGKVLTYQWNGSDWEKFGAEYYGQETEEHLGDNLQLNYSGSHLLTTGKYAKVWETGLTNTFTTITNYTGGKVDVYKNVSDIWTLYGNVLEGQADNDQFGTSIDIDPSGTILAVGALNGNGGKGNVNIYKYNETDSSWNKVGGDLSGDAVGDLTGTSVKLNQLGTEVSVGEPTSNYIPPYYAAFSQDSTKYLDWHFLVDSTTSVTDTISNKNGTYYRGSNSTNNSGTSNTTDGFTINNDGGNGNGSVGNGYGVGVYNTGVSLGNTTKFAIEMYLDTTPLGYGPRSLSSVMLFEMQRSHTSTDGWMGLRTSGNWTLYYYRNSSSLDSYSMLWPSDQDVVGKHHVVFQFESDGSTSKFNMGVNGAFVGQQTNTTTWGFNWSENIFLNLFGDHNFTGPSGILRYPKDVNVIYFRIYRDIEFSDAELLELYNNREPVGGTFGGARTFEIEHTKIYEREYNSQSNSAIIGHNEYSRNQFSTALDVSGNVDVSGNILVTGNVTIPGDITVDGLNYNSINRSAPISIDYSDITEDLSFNHKIEIMTNDNSLQTSSLTIHNDLSNNGTFGSSFVYDNSLSVTGSVVVVDASNTNYGSYTVYSKADGTDSFVVGKSASHVFNIVNQSNVGVWMQVDGNSFISTSDENLKKDIEDLGEETDSIMKLRPVKFHWNYEEEDKEKHIGFIAQEVEELFPDLVEENTYPDGSTYKGVDKTKLIPHLVNEIKSIKKEIEELKK